MGKNEWLGFFERVGFPIVVAFYFMFRMERVLERVIQVLIELEIAVARLN